MTNDVAPPSAQVVIRERALDDLRMKNSSREYDDDRAAHFLEKTVEQRVAFGVKRYDAMTK